MKSINFITRICIVSILLQQNLFPGFAGYAAQQQAATQQASKYQGLTQVTYASGSTSGGGGCTPCTGTTTAYIPPFNIQILNVQSGSPLNGTGATMLAANQSFNFPNCLLTVHIFPPSNHIQSSSKGGPSVVVPSTTDPNYLVFYTIKDFAGTQIFKTYDTFTSATLPHFIAIKPGTPPAAATGQTPGTFTVDSNGNACMGTFFPPDLKSPSGNPISRADKQKILNGISPIVQNFLFNIDNTNNAITVTHISGAFGSESSSYLKLNQGSYYSPAKATVGADALQPLNISFESTTLLTFNFSDMKNIKFTSQDLQDGIMLNVTIFPSANPTGGGNYPVVATLKTTDGNKLRKLSSTALQSLPTSITLSQGSNNPTVILTTNILSTAAQQSSNNYLYNIISPINLNFIISQPAGKKTLQVLMV